MESAEEPQKKIFKARKTMRTSDRQQLDALYKVKEGLLKSSEVKLLNGNHENGDSDAASPLNDMDYIEEKIEFNGIDVCLEPDEKKKDSEEIPSITDSDIRTSSQNCDQDGDLNSKFEPLPMETIILKQEQENSNITATEAENEVFDTNNDNDCPTENGVKSKSVDQKETDVLGTEIRHEQDVLEDKMEMNANSCNLISPESNSLVLPNSDFLELQESEEENIEKEKGKGLVEMNNKVKGVVEEEQGSEENEISEEMRKEKEIGVLIEMENKEEEKIVEEHVSEEQVKDEELKKEEKEEEEDNMLEKVDDENGIVKEEEEDKVLNVERKEEKQEIVEEMKDEDKVEEEAKGEGEEEILKAVGQTKEEEKPGVMQEMEKEGAKVGFLESTNEHEEKEEIKGKDEGDIQNRMQEEGEEIQSRMQEEDEVEKLGVVEEDRIDGNAGEEAISSSMEIDQDPKDEEEGSVGFPGTSADKSPSNLLSGCSLESPDSMETDEIIPILEKLAPVGDELNSFPKVSVLSGDKISCELDGKIENSLDSLSKQEGIESLPTEAFLVLSDEEEPCTVEEETEVLVPKESDNQEDKVFEDQAKEEEVPKEEQKEEEKHPGKGEFSRRKRSKSEDMDSVQSKRRRYEREEYEAELQVKITARGDVNPKLEKVIQKLLEEKLCALQCAVFDKTLADLKTRVEKIECKKHENVLNGIQAKIARLSKRFGAAKEDLKKRQEMPANPPASPGKPISDTNANSSMTYRNASTVRQMLESKRNVGEATTPFQAPANAGPSPSNQPVQRLPSTTQSPAGQTPSRAAPDWKLIRQRIPAASIAAPQTILSGQPKPSTPVTSASVMTSVLPAPTTATVVGTNQVPSGSAQPMSVSLQSLPVILHVPVAVSSQSQLLQGTTGTLVTNQQSGSVEFIPVQSQPAVGSITKTPVSLTSSSTVKTNNSPAVSSPGIQRNSPASSSSLSTTLAVQAVSTAHSVTQAARTSLPTVSTSGPYNPTPNRGPIQMKIPVSAFNNSSSSDSPAASRIETQNRTSTADSSASKRTAESVAQNTKTAGGDSAGVIDLTLDDEDDGGSQGRTDSRKTNQISSSGSSQSTQVLSRPLPPQTTTLPPAVVPAGLPSQTTIHVLPTAQTTVNVTHRPITQATTRVPIPRAPPSQQLVYTTLSTTAGQTPVRNGVMQSQGLRQVNPQTGGVTVRMPQTTAYVVNNGLAIGSGGPQLTVHHRPPQEPLRPLHPAPLPEAPQPQRLPAEASGTSLPQKPHLKLARVQSQNGIVLSWSVLEVDRTCAAVDSYHLYAYHEDPAATTHSQWKKIGEVKALPLPMACTLTQFVSGSKYYFAVRAKDIYGRFGSFCDPQSTDVISQSS